MPMALVVAMAEDDPLDGDTLDLINQLCTRIGMIMEDAAPLALQLSTTRQEVASRLSLLNDSVVSMAALVAAARSIAKV